MYELLQYQNHTFTFAALVLQGREGTFAVLQHVNMQEQATNIGWEDLLPSGTRHVDAGGDTVTPLAAIVTFTKVPVPGTDEHDLEPALTIPVDAKQAVAAWLANQTLWQPAN